MLGFDLRGILSTWLTSCVYGSLGLPATTAQWIISVAAVDGWPALMWVCAAMVGAARTRILRCSSAAEAELALISQARDAGLSPSRLLRTGTEHFPLWLLELHDSLCAACGLSPPRRLHSPPLHPALVRKLSHLPASQSASAPSHIWSEQQPVPSREQLLLDSAPLNVPKSIPSGDHSGLMLLDFDAIMCCLPNEDGTTAFAPHTKQRPEPVFQAAPAPIQAFQPGPYASVPLMSPSREHWDEDVTSLLGHIPALDPAASPDGDLRFGDDADPVTGHTGVHHMVESTDWAAPASLAATSKSEWYDERGAHTLPSSAGGCVGNHWQLLLRDSCMQS